VPSFIHTSGINIGSVSVAPKFLVALGALIVVAIGVDLFYSRTWPGIAMRGSADDREIAMLRGIDPQRLGVVAFLISGAIAGAGGFVLAPITFSDPTIGLTYTVKGFIALAVGGFGSIRGALVGALTLGVAEQVFDRYSNSRYELTAGLMVMLVVFLVKPTGLFAQRGVRRI
jgi:branched-chain amino acid transport system permease protein